jgi:hypothetical protein
MVLAGPRCAWLPTACTNRRIARCIVERSLVAAAVAAACVSTGIQPRQIGCVIVNSSLFNPTPSLSACIMNHFKMGSKTINYNLGGMGCSASLVAIDLAKQVRPCYALGWAPAQSGPGRDTGTRPGMESWQYNDSTKACPRWVLAGHVRNCRGGLGVGVGQACGQGAVVC